MLLHVTATAKRNKKAMAARKPGSKKKLPPMLCSRETARVNCCCEQGGLIWARNVLAPCVCLLGLHHCRWFTPATEHFCGGPYFVKRGSIKHTVATTAVPAAKVENAKGPQCLETTITAMKSNRDEKRRLMATIDALDSQYTALAASLHGQDSS
jgi:hypothetical protein